MTLTYYKERAAQRGMALDVARAYAQAAIKAIADGDTDKAVRLLDRSLSRTAVP